MNIVEIISMSIVKNSTFQIIMSYKNNYLLIFDPTQKNTCALQYNTMGYFIKQNQYVSFIS